MNKLDKKIKRLENKLSNTYLLRQIYILIPVALAALTGVATLISIPFNIMLLQILGVTTLGLVGATFCLNAVGDLIDIKFANKIQKLEKKLKDLKEQQNKANENAIEVVANNKTEKVSTEYLLEKGKERSIVKKADPIVIKSEDDNLTL